MENQESGNPSITNDHDDLGDLIYYDDDVGGGGEKSKIPKPYKPSLINHRNLAYNILKYLENDMVRNKEIPELGSCSECTTNILSLPIKALTILSCGHIFHRSCIEKQLLHTKPSTCPFTDCGKNVDIIMDPNSIRRGSQASSHSSGTSALTNLIGEKFVLNSPVIPEEGRQSDPMDVDPNGNVAFMNVLLSGGEQRSSKTTEVAKETSNQMTNPDNSKNVDDLISKNTSGQIQRPICEKCSEEISLEFSKDTILLSCQHAVHYDCIDNPRKKCPTCPSSETMSEIVSFTNTDPNDAQKKRTRESSASTEKSSSKKAKKTGGKKVSSMLKELIEELLTDVPVPTAEENLEKMERSQKGQPVFSCNSQIGLIMPKLKTKIHLEVSFTTILILVKLYLNDTRN